MRAAASIAEHYLRAGDRVGLLDTKWSLGIVAPGAGRRHLERIVDVLVDVDTNPSAARDPVPVERVLARIAPRSMVVLISPLVDLARPELAVGIARAGHPLLVVDTPRRAPSGDRTRPHAPTWPGGCSGCSIVATSTGSPISGSRPCPGAGTAASTACCAA